MTHAGTRKIRNAAGALVAMVLMLSAGAASAWDADGHRMITSAALEAASTTPGWPVWLQDATTREMIADQATTPDRWRSIKIGQLTHLNNPDHYLDAEELATFGMTLENIPRLRHEYVRQITLARAKSDFAGKPIDPMRDPVRVYEYPGFLPFAACETYGKLVSALRTVRALEKIGDSRRAAQMQMAKADAMTHMGILAHYLGDAAQPLHTTIHHHGWIGDNPNGYTTDKGFHSYIDGKIVSHHKIVVADLIAGTRSPLPVVEHRDPWDAVIDEVRRSFAQVEPLYVLKKSGELEQAPGREFIVSRMSDGARTLGAVYIAAWKASEVGEREVDDFRRFDGDDLTKQPAAPSGPKTADDAAGSSKRN